MDKDVSTPKKAKPPPLEIETPSSLVSVGDLTLAAAGRSSEIPVATDQFQPAVRKLSEKDLSVSRPTPICEIESPSKLEAVGEPKPTADIKPSDVPEATGQSQPAGEAELAGMFLGESAWSWQTSCICLSQRSIATAPRKLAYELDGGSRAIS